MFAFPRRSYSPTIAARTPRRSRRPHAVKVDVAARADAGCSPTTSVQKVLATLATALLLSLGLTARAVVHAGAGMPDGPVRTLTLAIGQATLRVAEVTHLTWPWDRLATALGNAPQPAAPPLLASSSAADGPPPAPRATQLPGKMPQGGAGAYGAERDRRPYVVGALRSPIGARRRASQLLLGPSYERAPGRQLTPSHQARAVRPVLEPKRHRAYTGYTRGSPRRKARPKAQPAQPPARTPPLAIPIKARSMAQLATPYRALARSAPRRTTGFGRVVVTPPSSQPMQQTPRTAVPGRRGRPPWVAYAHPSVARYHARVRRLIARPGGRRDGRPVHRSIGGHATAVPTHQNPLWRPTPGHPLQLLVTGDSLPGYLGPILLDEAAAEGPVRGVVDVHDGTGLTRPDFVDWSLLARQQGATYHPDAVVVWMGGNDFQNMTLPTGRFFLAGTPAWTREYQRRAEICMRIWTQGGARRVYWLSMPPARDPSWAYDDARINSALRRAAARVAGVEYLDILGPITDHGRYADYIYQNGQPVLVREVDGVHVNLAGSTIVAHEVLRVLTREWHVG